MATVEPGQRLSAEVGADGDRAEPARNEASELERLRAALQRQADELRELRARYHGLIDHTFEFMGLLAADGTLLEANRSSLAFVEARREDVIGRPFWETPWWVGQPEHQRRLRAAIASAANGEFVRFETTHVAADGQLSVFDFSLTPVRDADGKVCFLVPEGRDITERKRVELWQQSFADASALLSDSLDHRETIAHIAEVALRQLGDACFVDQLEPDGELRRLRVAVAGPTRAWFADVLERYSPDRARPHSAWTVLETRRPVLLSPLPEGHLEAVARSEEHLSALRAMNPSSLLAVPMIAHDKLQGVLTVLDTSRDRRYREEDVWLAQELAQRAALSLEHARLFRAAMEATAARDHVLAIVAHDLRNPLNNILLQLQLLRPRGAEPEPRQARAEHAIQREALRMNRQIQDLLDVVRIDSGRLAVAPDRVATGALLAELTEAQGVQVAAAAQTLALEVEEPLPDLQADRARMVQLLENLIGNAVKFTGAGGRITLSARPVGEHVQISVADTGGGIPAEHLPHVFDRFWQANRRDRRGAGLGLAIVKGIVEAHGGKLWVESKLGVGTTFHFTVPAFRAPGR